MFRTLSVLASALIFMAGQASAGLHIGDIVFAIDGAGAGSANAIVKANPITGNQTILSQPGVIGSGADFGSLVGGLAVDANGQIVVAGFSNGTLYKVDPETGNRTVLSGSGVGTGPSLSNVNDLTIAPDGQIYVTGQTAQSLIRVDPTTGDRTEISGPSTGTGTSFSAPFGITRTTTGNFFVYDANLEYLFYVDATTGNRTVFSGGAFGSGVPFGSVGLDVALLPNNDIATTDSNRIFRVDGNTGERSILSGAGVGDGPALSTVNFLSATESGVLLASGLDVIYRIDPTTGFRSIYTGDGVGTGYDFGVYRSPVQATVPEPSTVWLAAIASIAVGATLIVRRKAVATTA